MSWIWLGKFEGADYVADAMDYLEDFIQIPRKDQNMERKRIWQGVMPASQSAYDIHFINQQTKGEGGATAGTFYCIATPGASRTYEKKEDPARWELQELKGSMDDTGPFALLAPNIPFYDDRGDNHIVMEMHPNASQGFGEQLLPNGKGVTREQYARDVKFVDEYLNASCITPKMGMCVTINYGKDRALTRRYQRCTASAKNDAPGYWVLRQVGTNINPSTSMPMAEGGLIHKAEALGYVDPVEKDYHKGRTKTFITQLDEEGCPQKLDAVRYLKNIGPELAGKLVDLVESIGTLGDLHMLFDPAMVDELEPEEVLIKVQQMYAVTVAFQTTTTRFNNELRLIRNHLKR